MRVVCARCIRDVRERERKGEKGRETERNGEKRRETEKVIRDEGLETSGRRKNRRESKVR